jgi:hypothetical protein
MLQKWESFLVVIETFFSKHFWSHWTKTKIKKKKNPRSLSISSFLVQCNRRYHRLRRRTRFKPIRFPPNLFPPNPVPAKSARSWVAPVRDKQIFVTRVARHRMAPHFRFSFYSTATKFWQINPLTLSRFWYLFAYIGMWQHSYVDQNFDLWNSKFNKLTYE